MKQVYLIHSLDAKWVTRQREELVDQLVERDMRDESLLEIFSTSARALTLADILPDIISELATVPFLPGSRRVVVVHTLSDFLAGGRARSKARAKKKKAPAKGKKDGTTKRKPVEILASFIEKDLPATPNVLVFSTIIESDRGRYLDTKGALYKLVLNSPLAEILKPPYREEDPVFQMSDAFLKRDAVGCLRHFRAIYGEDTRTRIFSELLKIVRLLIQANVLKRIESQQSIRRETIEMMYLPDDKRLNLYRQAPFLQSKIKDQASRFQLRELMHALEQLLEINREFYPSKNVVYVRDVKLLFENFLIEFCEGRGAGAAL